MLSTLVSLAVLAPQGDSSGAFLMRPWVVQDHNISDELLFVAAGPAPATPVPFSTMDARFSHAAMLPAVTSPFRLSSFSSGSSRIVANLSDGRAVVTGPESWGALQFVVETIGPGAAQVYVDEVNGPGGIAGDIFSYWVDGSAIDGDFVGIVEKARDGQHLGVGQLADIDHNMTAVLLDGAIGDVAELANATFYFTVDRDSLYLFDDQWFQPAGTTVPCEKSAATILKITSSGPAWSSPSCFKTYRDLDCDPDDQITALCVDDQRKTILWAIDASHELYVATHDQEWDQPQFTGVYTNESGASFSSGSLGLPSGSRYRGACSNDPLGDMDDASFVAERMIGRPVEDRYLDRNCIEMALTRRSDRTSSEDFLQVFFEDLDCVAGSPAQITANGVIVDAFVVPATGGPLLREFPIPNTLYGMWRVGMQSFRGNDRIVTHLFEIAVSPF